MKKKTQSIRGMHDCLPEHVFLWQKIENVLKTVLNSYGYFEIRFPIIEFTNLFKHSMGEVTDVVEKEMYSFNDQHGYSLTLRPEGTSGCVRAGIEHSLFYHQEQRLWYLGPMFRYERPQKGRYRQFHQFGVEAFGQIGPDIDVELILITARCWKELGINQYISLELNSIGLLSSRMRYRKKLIDFLEKKKNYLDNTSISRLYSNPMRILDTKNSKLKELLEDAPVLTDYLDNDSKLHFMKLCKLLDLFKISYKINPRLVRGLDYYNRTVFEWITNDTIKIQKTICAGGRYDDLVQQLGGKTIPAVGFAIGLERVVLLMYEVNNNIIQKNLYIDIYLVYVGDSAQQYVMLLSEYIRDKLPSLRLKMNHGGGDLSKQFERANKSIAKAVLMVNEDCVSKRIVILKNLKSGKKEIIEYNQIIKKLNGIFCK